METVWNLASFCPVVPEEMFKECGRQTHDGGYKLTSEPSAQVSKKGPVAGDIDYVRYLSMQKANRFQ